MNNITGSQGIYVPTLLGCYLANFSSLQSLGLKFCPKFCFHCSHHMIHKLNKTLLWFRWRKKNEGDKTNGNCVYFRKISVAKLLDTYNFICVCLQNKKCSPMYRTLTKGNKYRHPHTLWSVSFRRASSNKNYFWCLDQTISKITMMTCYMFWWRVQPLELHYLGQS